LPLAGIAISPELVAMLTNDPGGTADIRCGDRRMSVRPPMRSRPVQNRETIASLIVVGAMLLSAGDVRAVPPGLGYCLVPALDRWRWKRREPVYQS
jgi:hypothetical protein